MVLQFFLSTKPHILDSNEVWFSSFWSEGPKNHLTLNILVSNFVPLGPRGVLHLGPWSCPSRSVCRPTRSHGSAPRGPCAAHHGPMAPPSKSMRRPSRSHGGAPWGMVRRPSRFNGTAPRGLMAPPLEVRLAPLKVPCCRPSRSEVRHPSRSQGTNFETKISTLGGF